MSKKIAKIDNENMNSLYGSEFARLAGKAPKTAADDDKGAPKDPQAFKDHEEYLATLKSALSDDKSQSFDPNDEKLD